jgi:hypothetical protein
MKTHDSFCMALFLSLTSTTIFASPIAAADAVIEYHTLPTAAPVSADHYSYGKISAGIRSLVFGLDKRGATSTDEEDWEAWHSQWKRQQQARRCNLWDVCVHVYKPGE